MTFYNFRLGHDLMSKNNNENPPQQKKPTTGSLALSVLSGIAELGGGLAEIQQKRAEAQKAFIIRINKRSPSAAQLFEYLAFADTEYKTNSAPYLSNVTGVDYYKLINILKHLDSQEIGDFVVGRKGKDSRITWAYSPKSIGKVAIGKSSVFTGVPKSITEYDGGGGNPNSTEHLFLLRKDFSLKLDLPSDFNRADQVRLTNWLSTLPFD